MTNRKVHLSTPVPSLQRRRRPAGAIALVALVGLLSGAEAGAAREKPAEADATAKPEAPETPVNRPGREAEAEPADDRPPHFSGGIELVSLYAQRGNTAAEDSTSLALQPNVALALPWGFYLGYWGSTTTYGRDPKVPGEFTPRAIEHDLASGWSADVGPGKVRVGLTYYLFQHYDGSDVPESDLAFEMAPKWGGTALGTVKLSVQTLLADCDWGNKGDTYALAHYDYDLAGKWKFALDVGFQSFESTKNLSAEESLALRNVDVTVARTVAETGLTLRLTAMLGGLDRDGAVQPGRLVWGVGWAFE